MHVNSWPHFTTVACRPPPGVTTYNECSKKVKEVGCNDVWYYCSSVGFKN
jgi:hypothetical protein